MRQLSRTPLLAWFLDPFNPVDTNFYGPYGDEPIRYTLNYIDPATRAVAVTDVEVGAIKVGQSFASNPGRTTTIAPLGAGFSVRATASRAALWQDGYDYAGLS